MMIQETRMFVETNESVDFDPIMPEARTIQAMKFQTNVKQHTQEHFVHCVCCCKYFLEFILSAF